MLKSRPSPEVKLSIKVLNQTLGPKWFKKDDFDLGNKTKCTRITVIESSENEDMSHVRYELFAGVGSEFPMVCLDIFYVNVQIYK